jgi:predicted metal-dependent hydrolase
MPDTSSSQLSLFDSREATTAWTVRVSRRARRLTVRVFHTGRVEVVVPPRTSARTVRDFLQRHRQWVESRRERARRELPAAAPFPPAAISLAAFGEHWSVHMAGGSGRGRLHAAGEGRLEIHGVHCEETLRQQLRAWVVAHAAMRLGPWLESLAREGGFSFGRMSVRRQRTRWGSCSSRGTISLNASLAFQRPAVVRYLLLHELAHTRHMNHSARFWRLVATYEPDWQLLDRELHGGWRRVPDWMFNDVE